MEKKIPLFQVAYYMLSLLVYMGVLFVSSKLLPTATLGGAMLVTYGMLFLVTPTIVVALMRLSLLKWYADPIAAAEIPLFLYLAMIGKQMRRAEVSFYDAFVRINGQLSADGGEGWIFLVGLFLLGLAASFSVARKNGESISYRLISRFHP